MKSNDISTLRPENNGFGRDRVVNLGVKVRFGRSNPRYRHMADLFKAALSAVITHYIIHSFI